MNHTNTVMVAAFVALGVMLVVGLAVIPAIDQAQARVKPVEGGKYLLPVKSHIG